MARVLEGGAGPGVVSRGLERGYPWERAVQEISREDRARFPLSEQSLSGLLASGSDGEFYSQLLGLGRSLERSRPEVAVRIYSVLAAIPTWSPTPGEARQPAQRLEALNGGGTWGQRMETFAASFFEQVSDPAALAGIAVGGLAFRAARLGVLSRFAASGVGRVPGHGLALASLAGFAAEVPAFSLSSNLVETLRGRGDWSLHGIRDSLFHGALNLGSMRVAGGLIGGLGRRYFRTADLGALSLQNRLGLGLVQQASMLGGILLSQRVEGFFHPERGSTSVSDQLGRGLATLLVFNASGAVARCAFGQRWARMENELEIRTRSLSMGLEESPRPTASAALDRIPAEDMAPVIRLHVPAPEVPGPRRWLPHLASIQATFDPVTPARYMLDHGYKIMGAARGSGGSILINDAALAQEVLSNPKGWLRVGTPLKVPESHPHIILMSNSTPFVNGATWEVRRRILRPAMTGASAMAAMDTIFEQSLNEFSQNWLREGRMSLTEDTMGITMRNNMRALMGLEPRAGEAIAAEMQQFLGGFLSPAVFLTQQLGGDRVIPGTPFARWLAQGDRLHRSLNELVESKRANPSQDPIGILLSTIDTETNRPLTNDQVIGELVTFYAAGHETTARTLGWALWALAHHPEAARRASQEVADVLQGRRPAYEDFRRLPFLRNVLNESQRLIPVLNSTLPRGTLEDTTLGGIRLPAGSNVAISTYAQHHDPAVFERPGEFRPERFENQKFHPYQLLPFGMGPRRCLGSVFADWQMVSTMAMMLQRYSFRPATSRVDYTISNTMTRPKGDLDLRVLPPGQWAESEPVTGTIRRFLYR